MSFSARRRSRSSSTSGPRGVARVARSPPELETLARTKTRGAIVAKVDTEAFPSISQRYAIRSIPTMILFRGGREAKRVSGAMSADRIAEGFAL